MEPFQAFSIKFLSPTPESNYANQSLTASLLLNASVLILDTSCARSSNTQLVLMTARSSGLIDLFDTQLKLD